MEKGWKYGPNRAGLVAFNRVGSKLSCDHVNPSQNVVQRGRFVKPELQAREAEPDVRHKACWAVPDMNSEMIY